MTMLEVMNCLHSSDSNEIINLLNRAIYVEQYEIKQHVCAVNTGVTFQIHTGSNFELVFDAVKEALIFKKCDYVKLPSIAGLLTKSLLKPFYESYNTGKILMQISVNDDFYFAEINEIDIKNNSFSHRFNIVDAHGNVIKSFPLSRKPPFIVYNGRTKFKRWYPEELYDEN
jgi:hypothetical protein